MEAARAEPAKAADDGKHAGQSTVRRTTALGIPCPWSGDERDEPPATYWMWFWLYKNSRKLRHLIGLHDWPAQTVVGSGGKCCTWCGHRTS